jgi:hypothetical protein
MLSAAGPAGPRALVTVAFAFARGSILRVFTSNQNLEAARAACARIAFWRITGREMGKFAVEIVRHFVIENVDQCAHRTPHLSMCLEGRLQRELLAQVRPTNHRTSEPRPGTRCATSRESDIRPCNTSCDSDEFYDLFFRLIA